MKILTLAQKAAKAKKMREYRAAKKATVVAKAVVAKAVVAEAVVAKAVVAEAKALNADLRKIKVLVSTNPYKVGSIASATFELLRESATVADFRAKVKTSPRGTYDTSYLTWATKPHGKQPRYIAVG